MVVTESTPPWTLAGPGGSVFASIDDAAKAYVSNYLPNWRSQHYMLPPMLSYKFEEPWGQADGAKPKVRPDSEDRSMHLVVDGVESFLVVNKLPGIVFQSFTMNHREGFVKHFLPFLKDQGFDNTECDLLIFSPRLGLIAIEVKGTEAKTKSKFAKKKMKKAQDGQLTSKLIRRLLGSIQQNAGTELPVRRLVAFPLRSRRKFSESQLADNQEVNGYLFFEDFPVPVQTTEPGQSQARSENQSGLHEQLSAFLLSHNDDKVAATDRLVWTLITIWSLSALKDRPTPTVTLASNSASMSHAVQTVNKRVKEQELVKPEKEVHSNIIRSNELLLKDKFNRVFFLTPQQQQALYGPRFQIIHGPAGTGKSIILAAKAMAQIRAGRNVVIVAPDNMSIYYGLWKQTNSFTNEQCEVISDTKISELVREEDEEAQTESNVHQTVGPPNSTTQVTVKQRVLEDLATFVVSRWRATNFMKRICGWKHEEYADMHICRVKAKFYGKFDTDEVVKWLKSLSTQIDEAILRAHVKKVLDSYSSISRCRFDGTISQFFVDRDIFVDDALCIRIPGEHHEWAFMSYISEISGSSENVVWLASDMTQIGSDAKGLYEMSSWVYDGTHESTRLQLERIEDDILKLVWNPFTGSRTEWEAAVEKILNQTGFRTQTILQQLSFLVFLGQLLSAFPLENRVQIFDLRTVLRCSRRIFDHWHSANFKWSHFRNNVEATKSEMMQIYLNVWSGHQIFGPNVVTHTVERRPKDTMAITEYAKIASLVSEEISALLSQRGVVGEKLLEVTDFVIIMALVNDETRLLFTEAWRGTDSGRDIWLCTIRQQLQGTVGVAVDSVSSSISLEWPAVIYVDNTSIHSKPFELILQTSFPRMEEYFALSRARARLVVIRVEPHQYPPE